MIALLFCLQDLVYDRRDTADATREASIAATRAALGGAEQSPWSIIGPFDNAGGRGVHSPYAPEMEIDLDAEYVGADGRMVRWRSMDFADGEVHDLDLFRRLNYSICYLSRTIEMQREGTFSLEVGSDDSVTVWVNGERVHDYLEPRGMPQAKDRVSVRLRAGTNTVLMKVGNWEGPTQFYYRLNLFGTELLAELERRLAEDFPGSFESSYYRIETIPVPPDVVLEVGGLAFNPDGVLMICTRRGEVWAVTDPVGEARWQLFAQGLHEPLGLWPGERAGELYTVQRPELTLLRDTDGDGTADEYQTVSDGWGLSGHYHEFAFGPVRDAGGNFYGTLNVAFHNSAVGDAQAPYRGWAFRVTPEGEFEPISSGLRSPNGIVMSPDGEIFVTDNQGDFVGTGPLYHVEEGDFHGHPAGLAWEEAFHGRDPFSVPMDELTRLRKPAAILFPFGEMGQSASQPVFDTTAGAFGPFAGQMLVGDQTHSSVMRCTLEQVGGEYQGACYPFLSRFQCGNNRLAWAPDGSLYAGQTDRGWGSTGGRPWGVQRVTWTGSVPMEIHEMRLAESGFTLEFTRPVDRARASRPDAYRMRHFRYLYHIQYGSPKVDIESVIVRSVEVSEDGRTVTLTLPRLVTGKIYELRIDGLTADDGTELLHPLAYYTLNRTQ